MEHPPEAKLPGDVSHALRVAATVLRTLFIILLLVLTLRVSLPQSETTAYDAPADLVRLILGVGVCDLGLVAVPFTLITLFAVW